MKWIFPSHYRLIKTLRRLSELAKLLMLAASTSPLFFSPSFRGVGWGSFLSLSHSLSLSAIASHAHTLMGIVDRFVAVSRGQSAEMHCAHGRCAHRGDDCTACRSNHVTFISHCGFRHVRRHIRLGWPLSAAGLIKGQIIAGS